MDDLSFEWDDDKRLTTIEKHGIDFIDAVEIFERDYLRLPGRSDTEERQIAIGRINEITIAVVYTLRDGAIRIITARRARREERERYETHLSGGDPAS